MQMGKRKQKVQLTDYKINHGNIIYMATIVNNAITYDGC